VWGGGPSIWRLLLLFSLSSVWFARSMAAVGRGMVAPSRVWAFQSGAQILTPDESALDAAAPRNAVVDVGESCMLGN